MSIENQIRQKIAIKLREAAVSVLPIVNLHLKESYLKEEFFHSLNSGLLKAEMGLTNSKASHITQAIINELIENTKAEYIPGTSKIMGILQVRLKTGLSDSLYEEASYISNGHKIDWLNWIMKKGTQVIVSNFEVNYTSSKPSRSGLAVMKYDKGSIFRVEPRYSGIESDNIISRYLQKQVKDIQQIMITNIKKQFK
jgi:hypothetical protein